MKVNEGINAYLGRDTEFEGNLKFYGKIRIDGHFRGEILGEGTLIIGESATLESDIQVSCVLNHGQVLGNIVADQKAELRAPGKVLGNIQAPAIVIHEGAAIDGNCRTQPVKRADERKLTVVGSERS
ncbi:MAG: polymer-forming cytoskeletal protein [Deltaproteobacteria bacterium]|jgi:cytoskeletal protein CcmA (bactofilin family)